MNIRVLACLRTMSTNAGDVQVDAAWKGMIKVGQVNSNGNSENTTEDEREEKRGYGSS